MIQSTGVSTPDLIYRFVDEKGAVNYVKRDMMIGRHRHYLPAKITGLLHSKPQTGLSFSKSPRQWWMNGNICFVVDRSKIDVPSHEINGHAIYMLTQMMDDRKAFMSVSKRELEMACERAIRDSLRDPTEVFVVPSIRGLSDVLVEIRIMAEIDKKALMDIRSYCEKFKIPLKNFMIKVSYVDHDPIPTDEDSDNLRGVFAM